MVKWKTGDPLPSGTFFADYDKDGWPIGVAVFKGNPGTLYIKDMLARIGTYVVAYEDRESFQVLCDGDLEWTPSNDGVTLPRSVRAGFGYRFCVGKYEQDGEIYVGKVESTHKSLCIAFRQGESRIYKNYFHLIDKNWKSYFRK